MSKRAFGDADAVTMGLIKRRKTSPRTDSRALHPATSPSAAASKSTEGSPDPSYDSGSRTSGGSSRRSSSGEEDNDTVKDAIVTVGGPRKPLMRLGSADDIVASPSAGVLRSRLATFLPQMVAANQELESLKRTGDLDKRRLDNVDDSEGRYIEMDLSLGVLEEKRNGAEADTSDSDSSNTSRREAQSILSTSQRTSKAADPMSKLMGQKRQAGRSAGIQEIDDVD